MSDFICSAFAVRQPNATFYVASVNAVELQTICTPLARAGDAGLFGRDLSDPVALSEIQLQALVRSMDTRKFRANAMEILTEEREQPYQRFLDEKRAVQISRYIQQSTSMLPNSITLAVDISLDESDIVRVDGNGHVSICLPRIGTSAVILDGQHRVAAFRYIDDRIRQNYELLVAFLIGIPFYQQAELFAIINGKQKPVNRSIIYDLFGYAPIDGDKDGQLYEGLMAVSRFCSHVTRILDRVTESPWKSKIKMRGPGDDGVISQAAVVEYLSALVEPKTSTKRLKILPLLYSFFKKSDPAGCASLVILYLSAIQSALPSHWGNKKSLLWKNNGIAVIVRILHDELILAGGSDKLMNAFPQVVARWRKAPEQDLVDPPKTGGGGVQNQLYEKFRAAMFNQSEVLRLEEMKEPLKENLIEIGGIVR